MGVAVEVHTATKPTIPFFNRVVKQDRADLVATHFSVMAAPALRIMIALQPNLLAIEGRSVSLVVAKGEITKVIDRVAWTYDRVPLVDHRGIHPIHIREGTVRQSNDTGVTEMGAACLKISHCI